MSCHVKKGKNGTGVSKKERKRERGADNWVIVWDGCGRSTNWGIYIWLMGVHHYSVRKYSRGGMSPESTYYIRMRPWRGCGCPVQ